LVFFKILLHVQKIYYLMQHYVKSLHISDLDLKVTLNSPAQLFHLHSRVSLVLVESVPQHVIICTLYVISNTVAYYQRIILTDCSPLLKPLFVA